MGSNLTNCAIDRTITCPMLIYSRLEMAGHFERLFMGWTVIFWQVAVWPSWTVEMVCIPKWSVHSGSHQSRPRFTLPLLACVYAHAHGDVETYWLYRPAMLFSTSHQLSNLKWLQKFEKCIRNLTSCHIIYFFGKNRFFSGSKEILATATPKSMTVTDVFGS